MLIQIHLRQHLLVVDMGDSVGLDKESAITLSINLSRLENPINQHSDHCMTLTFSLN